MRWGDILCKGSCDKYGCKAANSTDEGCMALVPVFAADVLVVFISTTVNSNAKNNEDLESELDGRIFFFFRRMVLTTMVTTLSKLNQYST